MSSSFLRVREIEGKFLIIFEPRIGSKTRGFEKLGVKLQNLSEAKPRERCHSSTEPREVRTIEGRKIGIALYDVITSTKMRITRN